MNHLLGSRPRHPFQSILLRARTWASRLVVSVAGEEQEAPHATGQVVISPDLGLTPAMTGPIAPAAVVMVTEASLQPVLDVPGDGVPAVNNKEVAHGGGPATVAIAAELPVSVMTIAPIEDPGQTVPGETRGDIPAAAPSRAAEAAPPADVRAAQQQVSQPPSSPRPWWAPARAAVARPLPAPAAAGRPPTPSLPSPPPPWQRATSAPPPGPSPATPVSPGQAVSVRPGPVNLVRSSVVSATSRPAPARYQPPSGAGQPFG